ncbi:hypothetical protein ACGO3R_07265 [Lactococcus lactis]
MRFKGGTSNLLNNNLDTSIDYNNIFSASQTLRDVYRLYNVYTGEHFYTLNYAEKQIFKMSVGVTKVLVGFLLLQVLPFIEFITLMLSEETTTTR